MKHHGYAVVLMLLLHGTVLWAGIPQRLPADRSYIENKGQVGDQDGQPNRNVRFLIVRPGLNIQLRTNGFSYDSYVVDRCELPSADDDGKITTSRRDRPNEELTYRFHRVDIELVDANPAPVIESRVASADYLNYYTHVTAQANGEQGATAVRGYGRVTYRDVWPGIDLEWFIDEEGNPEYQFMVRPGGDPNRIRLRYHGANATDLAEDAIMIHVDHGPIREHIPKSFYAGSGQPVDVRYRKVGHNTFGVVVPSVAMAMAVTETLVIDPTPQRLWGTYYGGTGEDYGYAVAVTSADDVVLSGITMSTAAIATTGAHQQSFDGGYGDGFLAVLTKDGVRRWATYFGGERLDICADVAVTPTGDVVLVGTTESNTGIATAASHQQTKGGFTDAFVAVFTNAGVRRWGTYYGGADFDRDYCTGITVTNAGDIVVVGGTESSDGIATTGSHQEVLIGSTDGFMAVFTNDGKRRWGTYYPGIAYDVAVTKVGDIVLAGTTASKTDIATVGAHQPVNGGGGINGDAWLDAYLAVFTDAGIRRWGTYYGGDGREQGRAVAVTPTNDIVLVGLAGSDSAIATAGAHQQTRTGSEDAFVAVFSDVGIRRWGTYYGGTFYDPDTDQATVAAAVTPSGDIVIVSSTDSPTGIASPGSYQETLASGLRDACLAVFSDAGQRRWGTYFGGTGIDDGVAVAVTPTGDFVLAGSTESRASIATAGTHQQTFRGGGYDAFVATFRTVPCVRPPVTLTSEVVVDEICVNQVTTLTASAETGTRVQWTQPKRGTITSSITDTTISVQWTSVGVDTVRVRVMRTADSTCLRDTMFVVTVNALPTPVIASARGFTMCSGDSLTLDAGPGYETYAWFEGITPVGTGRYLVTSKASPYAVRVTNAQCSGISATVTTMVNPLPTASVTENPAGTITATTNASPASYQWCDASADPWTVITGATSSTFAPTASGRYGVEITNTATSCSRRSAAINVTLSPPQNDPVLTALTPSAAVCQGGNVTLRVRVVGGKAPYGYQWADGATALPSTDTAATCTPSTSTTVTCIVTDADGKRDTTTMTVTVKPRPVAAITEGPAGILKAVPAGADSYQWLDASRMPVVGATSAIFRPRTSGTYYAEVTQQSCVDTSDAITYTAPPNGGLEVSDYRFETVPIDDLINVSGGHVGSVRVQNLTGGYLELTGATTDDPSTFVVPQQWPRRLNNGDTAEIAVRFRPTVKRPYSTVITVATSTSLTGSGILSGAGRDLSLDERVTQVVLRPSRTEVDPGDTISVQLLINVEWPQATAGQVGRFISTIQWDNRVLEPVLTPGMDFDTTGTYAVASVLDGKRQQNQMQLYTFRFRAKQSEVDTTTILFRGSAGFAWQDDRKSYAALLDSVVRVRVCRDGGPQLIGRSQPPTIVSITPNPARDEVAVAYSIQDDGMLELLAADGKVVATAPARRTASSARFDLSSLSAGIYTVILRASGGSTHQSMVVIP